MAILRLKNDKAHINNNYFNYNFEKKIGHEESHMSKGIKHPTTLTDRIKTRAQHSKVGDYSWQTIMSL